MKIVDLLEIYFVMNRSLSSVRFFSEFFCLNSRFFCYRYMYAHIQNLLSLFLQSLSNVLSQLSQETTVSYLHKSLNFLLAKKKVGLTRQTNYLNTFIPLFSGVSPPLPYHRVTLDMDVEVGPRFPGTPV